MLMKRGPRDCFHFFFCRCGGRCCCGGCCGGRGSCCCGGWLDEKVGFIQGNRTVNQYFVAG